MKISLCNERVIRYKKKFFISLRFTTFSVIYFSYRSLIRKFFFKLASIVNYEAEFKMYICSASKYKR